MTNDFFIDVTCLSSSKDSSKLAKMLKLEQFISCLPQSQLICWKNTDSVYQGCNDTYARMSKMPPKLIIDKTDYNLTPLKPKVAEEFIEIDKKVLDSLEIIESTKNLYFQNDFPCYVATSKIIPLCNESGNASGVLCIGTYERVISEKDILKLVNQDNINQFLQLKKYRIKMGSKNCILSNREAACLLYLMKGKTAKETARDFKISNRTVEYYIDCMKVKSNCHTKSELISFGYENNFLSAVKESSSSSTYALSDE